MKRNAKINSRKLSLICLVLTLVIAMTAIFVVTASAAETKATLTFDANKSNRTSFSTSKQVWEQNGIIFTNDKASSSNNVADYGNPVRLYKSSKITIKAPGNITEIVFKCVSKYVLSGVSGATTSGTTVTVNLDGTSDTFSVASLSAQTRFYSIDVTYQAADCDHTNVETKIIEDATCTKAGKEQTICSDCGFTENANIPALGHNYVDGFCSRCDEAEPESYEGRYYIATKRSSGNYFYMNNLLGSASTKRYQAVDSGLTTLPTFIDTNNALSNQIFVLVRNSDGTYKIYAEGLTSSNYLGWTSGNSGALVAEGSAKNLTVAKKDDGTFNISFDGRYLSLNGTSGNNYFAWYEGSQRQDLTLIPVVEPEPECDHTPKLDCANVNLGQSLALKYYVELCEHANVADYTMKFTMNGVETTVSAEAEKYNGLYVFTLGGIAPQCMGDEIVAELIYEGTAALTKTYSVKQNLIDLLADVANADDNELKTLIYNTLAYGAEAQKYTGYKTDALVNAGYEALATQNAQPADAHVLSALKDGATASFKSAAVEFGDVNKIIVKINATDVANVTLKVGETALTLTKVSDGVYAATTDAISALNLGAKVGFNLYVGEDLVQTLTYSVNDYASRKWDDAEMGALVKALYNYGVAARLYWAIPEKN